MSQHTVNNKLPQRALVQAGGCGLAYTTLSGLAPHSVSAKNALAPKALLQAPRIKRVIMLFMHGGPNQVDTFDYKPQLDKDDGKDLPLKAAANIQCGHKADEISVEISLAR